MNKQARAAVRMRGRGEIVEQGRSRAGSLGSVSKGVHVDVAG